MQKKEGIVFEKNGNNTNGAWGYFLLGFIAIFGGGVFSIIAVLIMGYGIYLLTKKSKVVIYTTGFSILEGENLRNISFERLLGIKGELNQNMEFFYLNKPFFDYSEEELKDISYNQDKYLKIINFSDELLEKDFPVVFDIIKEQFKNFVFEKYENDLEKIIASPYLFNQINNDKLTFTKHKFWSGISRKIVQLKHNDTVKVSISKKIQIPIGKINNIQSNQSFEPQWKFSSTLKKYDTANLINTVLIQEILIKKYNIRFIQK